ncbi:tRNA lysidine(34) synthetase TilS [Luteimonas sp BLCC-B24]|uniref:tRNA lysidine(34) synthetase TilS n=1 Tax=Luteimonas sp. BLCC-B24 TaxID=3025317 RepID=UPI00234CA154|nr:tRNA lysidine(34) synthetase TilS [Luteimonas sp. BLCC-B24]MDC7806541.1 tRNA lysidine(34) synthetase TilS [Luteimonas sp. BLCC-B24]
MSLPHAVLPLPRPPAPGPICVGFSGGLDSTVLLHRLTHDPAFRARGVRAIHVHHGLQPGADAWADHCARLCADWHVELDSTRVTVARDAGRGLEAAAREARHAAFAAHLPPGGVIALAHHRDDQAETVLLRALRASGPDGLAGMAGARRFGGGWLWRPLLALPRSALLAYAEAHGLRWIDDPSNDTDGADRNFVRNRILPLLRTRWPQAGAALADVAALQAESVALLDVDDACALADARTLDPAVLRIDRLQPLPSARRGRVLRRWILERGLTPLPRQGAAWCDATLDRDADDRTPIFDWAGTRLQRWRDLLHAAPIRPPLPADIDVAWTGAAPLALPDGDTLRLDGPPADAMPWQVRARRGGERIALPGRMHSHALRHVLQALGVPPWVRARLPLLCDGAGRVLAVGDLAFDRDFDTWLRDGGRRLIWHTAARTGPGPIA